MNITKSSSDYKYGLLSHFHNPLWTQNTYYTPVYNDSIATRNRIILFVLAEKAFITKPLDISIAVKSDKCNITQMNRFS